MYLHENIQKLVFKAINNIQNSFLAFKNSFLECYYCL